MTAGWNEKSRAVPIGFNVLLGALEPGRDEVQVSVLEPNGRTVNLWRAPRRPRW